ncbi:hypothetical protein D9M69_537160 [compost metagenome]
MIRDFRIADLRLGAHDALGDGGRGREKGPGDFFRGQVADFPQRQWHLCVGRQGRVAASEDQPQAIVFHVFITPVGLLQFLQLRDQQGLRRGKACAPAQGIDGLEAPGGHQPSPRIVRHAVTLPAFDRDEKRLVQGLFGEVEITQQANQGRKNPPRLFAINPLDLRLNRQPRHLKDSTAERGALRHCRPGPPVCSRRPGWLR